MQCVCVHIKDHHRSSQMCAKEIGPQESENPWEMASMDLRDWPRVWESVEVGFMAVHPMVWPCVKILKIERFLDIDRHIANYA